MYVWSKALSGNNCFPQVGSADWQVAGRLELRRTMGTQADRAPTFRQRTARDGLGARLHGATACSLDLRRMDPEPIARCKPLQVKKDEKLGVSRFCKQLLCNQGTTFRRGESLKWAADKRQRLLLEVAHLSRDRPMRTQIICALKKSVQLLCRFVLRTRDCCNVLTLVVEPTLAR